METKTERLDISDFEGNVVIRFEKPRQHLIVDPETARQLGEQLARSSYKARFGIEANTNVSNIASETRQMLVTRATHIIRSMQENKKLPAVIAVNVVDSILSSI